MTSPGWRSRLLMTAFTETRALGITAERVGVHQIGELIAVITPEVGRGKWHS